MSGNSFSGDLPASLFALPRLKILDLSYNNFGGHIPISSSSGPISLEVLDLRYNNLSGILPFTGKNKKLILIFRKWSPCFILQYVPPVTVILLACVAAFKNIRDLNLGGNQFGGSLPASLFALPHLKFLDLSNNNFHGYFPINLASEPIPLEVLHLEGNKLSEALQNEQGTLTRISISCLYRKIM
jgi:Leucine-rich repeat (LRR) protein